MLTMWFRDRFTYVKELKYIMCYRQYLDILYPKHEIKLKVDGYMKNGGKKNETDSKLDIVTTTGESSQC